MKVNFKNQVELIRALYDGGKTVSDNGWNVWKVKSGQLYKNDEPSNEFPNWEIAYYDFAWESKLSDTQWYLCFVSNNSIDDAIKTKTVRLINFYNGSYYYDTEKAVWKFASPIEGGNDWILCTG